MSRWLRVLLLTRDVFMFGPILFTWYHLADAARAFADYRDGLGSQGSGDGPVEQTFLALWVDGFDGEATPLSVVAMQVLGFVILVAVLTALAGWFELAAEVAGPAVADEPGPVAIATPPTTGWGTVGRAQLGTPDPELALQVRRLNDAIDRLTSAHEKAAGGDRAALRVAEDRLRDLVRNTDEIATSLARMQRPGSHEP